MASDVFTITELIAVLTVYCIVFCPILCWAISGSMPAKHLAAKPMAKKKSPSLS